MSEVEKMTGSSDDMIRLHPVERNQMIPFAVDVVNRHG